MKMSMIKLYPHQQEALNQCANENRVAFFHDMQLGLGKTFTGSEKLHQLNGRVNLVICQKSKINDWFEHFHDYYSDISTYDLTDKKQFQLFLQYCEYHHDLSSNVLGIINYDIIFRRHELSQIHIDTLMLDESSLIQNESAKRSKFILKKLSFDNVILLSGTPTNGKYENLWSQIHLLGWNISKDLYWKQYIDSEWRDYNGFLQQVVVGYKNVDRLKMKLREHGAQFLKTEEVLNLPEQIEQFIKIPTIKEYRKFRKDLVVEIEGETLLGDNTLTQILYERQLCGHYNDFKLKAFEDLLQSTSDRLIVFYNFKAEAQALMHIANEHGRPWSIISGDQKTLAAYENYDNSITFVQYQAGAMGLNLQKANKLIYFTLPLGKGSCGLWEQSKKRIHRIGQNNTCFYYYLLCRNSIEERNLEMLKLGRDLTDELFIENGE